MNLTKTNIKRIHFFQLIRNNLVALLFVVGTFSTCYSQYSVSAGVNYVYAFGERTISFQNETYDLNPTHGYEVTLNNAYLFPTAKIQAELKVGFRQLYFGGNSVNVTYSGQLNKLMSGIGCRYFLSENLGIAGFIEAENNKELEDFNIGDGDLFRVSLSAEARYSFSERFALTGLMSRAMTPITEAYIIYNPQYQVRLGITYQILK